MDDPEIPRQASLRFQNATITKNWAMFRSKPACEISSTHTPDRLVEDAGFPHSRIVKGGENAIIDFVHQMEKNSNTVREESYVHSEGCGASSSYPFSSKDTRCTSYKKKEMPGNPALRRPLEI